MIIERSMDCPNCGSDHSNACYITYANGSHCYSCGYNNSKSGVHYVFREQRAVVANGRNVAIPENIVYDPLKFDSEVLQWLFSHYLYESQIKHYRIGYVPESRFNAKSVILPIFDEFGCIIEYQRRFFPKAFFSTSGVKKSLFIVTPVVSLVNTLCLVEDYISALRVGQHANTLCLFGTSLSKELCAYICATQINIYIWLDPDNAGQQAAKKLEHQLEQEYRARSRKFLFNTTGATITQIKTHEQPKSLSPAEIHKIIKGV